MDFEGLKLFSQSSTIDGDGEDAIKINIIYTNARIELFMENCDCL